MYINNITHLIRITRSDLMTTAIHYKQGVAILKPTGKIISTAIPEFRKTMVKHIDTTYTPRVLIDFERVHKMDSAGLGVFITAYNIARSKEGGRIGIINVGKHIRNVVVQTRLINIFEHYKNEDAAIAALSSRI